MERHDTISALSSGSGRSALALIRVSGPSALACLESLSGLSNLKARHATYCVLRNSKNEILDEVVATYFKAPNSYTGEDLVELAVHGNPVLVDQILDEIVSRGTRRAEPGEFTARALANGKLSLDQVESLDWILNAQSLKAAQRGLKAKLSGVGIPVDRARQRILELLADIEAQLDFPEHEVGDDDEKRLAMRIQEITDELSGWCRAYDSSRYELDAWVVSLVGPPNSGKSSLFNTLCETSKAIVFDKPGTTRDAIEHQLSLGGQQVLLIDTAGIRAAPEEIEEIGVQKSFEAMERSNLIAWISADGEKPAPETLERFKSKEWIYISSKADLGKKDLASNQLDVSIISKQGLDGLKKLLLPPADTQPPESGALLTSLRQKRLIEDSLKHLALALENLESGHSLELVAQSIRESAESLGEIMGRIAQEDLLKSILGRFCIGK